MNTIASQQKTNYRGEKSIVATVLNVGEYDYEIHTSKRSGGMVTCWFQSGKSKDEGSYTTFSFVIFQDPSETLATLKGRATEENLLKVHAEGLKAFREKFSY